MLLTDKYADKIYDTLTCYDRMSIQGYIPGMIRQLEKHSSNLTRVNIFTIIFTS